MHKLRRKNNQRTESQGSLADKSHSQRDSVEGVRDTGQRPPSDPDCVGAERA